MKRVLGFIEVPSRIYERAIKAIGGQYVVVPGRGYAAWVFEGGEAIRLPRHPLALQVREVLRVLKKKD